MKITNINSFFVPQNNFDAYYSDTYSNNYQNNFSNPIFKFNLNKEKDIIKFEGNKTQTFKIFDETTMKILEKQETPNFIKLINESLKLGASTFEKFSNYINNIVENKQKGFVLLAKDSEDKILSSIGISKIKGYEENDNIGEIIGAYISPDLKDEKIASFMYDKIEEYAKENKIQYLFFNSTSNALDEKTQKLFKRKCFTQTYNSPKLKCYEKNIKD